MFVPWKGPRRGVLLMLSIDEIACIQAALKTMLECLAVGVQHGKELRPASKRHMRLVRETLAEIDRHLNSRESGTTQLPKGGPSVERN